MALMPGAVWRPIPASTTRMAAHDIVCLHTMVMSLVDCEGYFRRTAPGVNAHYGTGHDGEIRQWVDTRFRSGANYSGNHRVISVENADRGPGFPAWDPSDASKVPAFTDAQVEANARILAWECSPAAHADCPPTWACHREGIPLALIPDAKPGRRGVGYHRQGVPGYMVAGAEQWSTARGKVCPGDRRIAQIPQIIARARQIASGAPTPAPSEEDDMARLITTDRDDRVLYVDHDSHSYYHVKSPDVVRWLKLQGVQELPGKQPFNMLADYVNRDAPVAAASVPVAAGSAGSLSDADLDRIAKAVADEQARRQAA